MSRIILSISSFTTLIQRKYNLQINSAKFIDVSGRSDFARTFTLQKVIFKLVIT